MGMCPERVQFHVELQRHIVDGNRWVTVKRYNRMRENTFSANKQMFPLTEICGGNAEN